MKRFMNVLFLLYWVAKGACSCDVLPTPPPSVKKPDSVIEKAYSTKLRVKKRGDNLYIATKIDKETDILYWFKRCMFNELFTFYRVGIISNYAHLPIETPDDVPAKILNLAFSDNIGPFNIAGHGWCGGNHPYVDELTRTAHNLSYQVYLDGKESRGDAVAWVESIKIRVVNNIMNPSIPSKVGEDIQLNDVLCVETVDYSIQGNSIQVSLTHLFKNSTPVVIQMYYGMQSMFDGETQTLTSNGKYTDWTPQASVSTFQKREFPTFRRFIEKSPTAYQSSYLLADGLGNHLEVSEQDVLFIGNSHGKTYHKIIGNQTRKGGDSTHWSGVYTWFKTPICDDSDMLCYEGVIGGKDAVFVDCKRAVDRDLTVSEKYTKREFTIIDKNESVAIGTNQAIGKKIRILSKGAGSCVIVFN